MCADPDVVALAKQLINDQYPNASKLGAALVELEAARTDPNIAEKQWKTLEEEKRFQLSRAHLKEAQDELVRIEERMRRFKERERQAKERAANPPPPQPIIENEALISVGPYPIEFDRDIKRVSCRVQYRIIGQGYETINAVRGNIASVAVYTVQPGGDNWIVELISVSELQ